MAVDVGRPSRQTTGRLDGERHNTGLPSGFPVRSRNPGASQAESGLCERAPTVAREYLQKEKEKGRVIVVGRAEEASSLGVHCSPFGVIPKKGKAGGS